MATDEELDREGSGPCDIFTSVIEHSRFPPPASSHFFFLSSNDSERTPQSCDPSVIRIHMPFQAWLSSKSWSTMWLSGVLQQAFHCT